MGTAETALEQGVGALYTDHHGWLQGWLRRRLDNACDAADLAHDTFVRLMCRASPPRFDSPAAARLYLRTTAQNLCIKRWQRQEVERAWLEMYWDMENTYGDVARNQQPARAIVDLSARYRLTKNVHLKLDVNNVFDKVYYSSIGYGDAWGSSEVYGRPRSALLTLNASY